MHPVSRILCLIALAAGLATAAPAALLLATVLLLGISFSQTAPIWLPTLYRLRWIFISLFILYAWFTPDQPIWPVLGEFSPTWAGLELWLLRSWMLWLMAAAARLLMQETPRAELIAGLYLLLRPLSWIGLQPQRFCLRLVLSLEYALAQRPTAERFRNQPAQGKMIERAAGLVRARFQAAERQAADAPLEAVTLTACGMPPWYEWFYPAALLAALLLLAGVRL